MCQRRRPARAGPDRSGVGPPGVAHADLATQVVHLGRSGAGSASCGTSGLSLEPGRQAAAAPRPPRCPGRCRAAARGPRPLGLAAGRRPHGVRRVVEVGRQGRSGRVGGGRASAATRRSSTPSARPPRPSAYRPAIATSRSMPDSLSPAVAARSLGRAEQQVRPASAGRCPCRAGRRRRARVDEPVVGGAVDDEAEVGVHLPRLPEPARAEPASRTARTTGWQAIHMASIRKRSWRRAEPDHLPASAALSVSGFSHSTCLPASSASGRARGAARAGWRRRPRRRGVGDQRAYDAVGAAVGAAVLGGERLGGARGPRADGGQPGARHLAQVPRERAGDLSGGEDRPTMVCSARGASPSSMAPMALSGSALRRSLPDPCRHSRFGGSRATRRERMTSLWFVAYSGGPGTDRPAPLRGDAPWTPRTPIHGQ